MLRRPEVRKHNEDVWTGVHCLWGEPRDVLEAIWVIFLIVLPYLTALVYLIARGKGMAERARDQAMAAKRETDDYIKHAAGRSPAQEIADAKNLLETGTISQAEFDTLKAKALS